MRQSRGGLVLSWRKIALVRMIEVKEKLHQEGLLAKSYFVESFDKREHITYDKSLEFDLESSRLGRRKIVYLSK